MNDELMDIELTAGQLETAVEQYVKLNMREVSQTQFRDWLTNTSDVKEALFNAVINESLNDILETYTRLQAEYIEDDQISVSYADIHTAVDKAVEEINAKSAYQQTVDAFETEVWCNVQVEATHNWPGCPFDEVSYLRDLHRHVFHIKAYKKVTHSDRDQEFIMLKHQIADYLHFVYFDEKQKLCVLNAMSCEMLAEELIMQFDLSRCEVSEDNENGAVVNARDVTKTP